jgi:hypothetical protein
MSIRPDKKSPRPQGFDDTGVVDFELMPFDERTSELFPTTSCSALSGYATQSGDSTVSELAADVASKRSRLGHGWIAVAAAVAIGATLLFALGRLLHA